MSSSLSFPPTSPNKFDERLGFAHQRLDGALIVSAVLSIDLGGHLQFPPERRAISIGAIQALLRSDPPNEQEIISGIGPEGMQPAGQTVIDGSLPVRPGNGTALVVGNGEPGVPRDKPGEGV